MFGWVTKIASEVQQFGENCIESIVGDEEAPAPEAQPAPRPPPREDAEEGSRSRGEAGDADWGPTEFQFVGRQTQALANLGWGIVEKGAGMALAILGDDEDGSPTRPQRDDALFEVAAHLKRADVPETVAAVAEEHPLEKLRACRGYLGMLRRQQGTEVDPSSASRANASRWITPSSVAEVDVTDSLYQECVWVEGSMVGRRIVTTRKLLTSPLDDETGEPLEGEAVVTALPRFKIMSVDACDAIARIVVEEIAEIFARPTRTLDSTLCDLLIAHRADQEDTDDRGAAAYWFLRHHDQDVVKGEVATWSYDVAKSVTALTMFALCEMGHGADALCKTAQECAAWARRTERPDAKDIKELSMTVRGECLSANVDAIVMLEEALEIVVSLFPEVEGSMPLEPLRMGAPLEFVTRAPVAVASVELSTEQQQPAAEEAEQQTDADRLQAATDETSGQQETEAAEVTADEVIPITTTELVDETEDEQSLK